MAWIHVARGETHEGLLADCLICNGLVQELHQDFEDFDEEHPEVYELFKQFAFQAFARRPRFSARTILHRIRWHTQIESTEPDFKINNNWSPYLARKLIREHPQFDGFFELRNASGDES